MNSTEFRGRRRWLAPKSWNKLNPRLEFKGTPPVAYSNMQIRFAASRPLKLEPFMAVAAADWEALHLRRS